jgi:hypothetical protein
MVQCWKCDRLDCGHKWLSPTKPKRCAKCKSPYWDRIAGGFAGSLETMNAVMAPPRTAAEYLTDAIPGVTVASALPRKIRGAKLQDEAFVPFEDVE